MENEESDRWPGAHPLLLAMDVAFQGLVVCTYSTDGSCTVSLIKLSNCEGARYRRMGWDPSNLTHVGPFLVSCLVRCPDFRG